jgi:hypothetical protein
MVNNKAININSYLSQIYIYISIKIIVYIKAKNELWAFGSCLKAQLGIGKLKAMQSIPINVTNFMSNKYYFKDVAPGPFHTISITGSINLIYIYESRL